MQVSLRSLHGHSSAVNAVRFTADGKYCCTCSDDKTVKLWNPHADDPSSSSSTSSGPSDSPQGLLIKSYSGSHSHGILDIAISHDNTQFVSAGKDRAVYLHDVGSGNVIRRIQAHEQRTNAVLLNSDSNVLMTASYDQSVRLWDLRSQSRTPVQILSDFKDSATSLALTGDSSIVVGCVDGVLRTYDVRKGVLESDMLNDPIVCVRLTNDSKAVLSMCLTSEPPNAIDGNAGINNNLHLTEIETGQYLKSYEGGINSSYKSECCACSDDNHISSGSEDGFISFWNIVSGKLIKRIRHGTPINQKAAAISSVSHHPTESLLLSSAYDGTVRLWSSKI